jgi:hypothetical protein
MKNLLSIDTNAKTVKGQKLGFMTGILYLAPFNLSGYQVCAMAEKAKCHEPCLNKAGRGAFDSTQAARIRKTRWFFERRESFMQALIYSINALIRKAEREGFIPLVRLNGTSDIRWEDIKIDKQGRNIFELFPTIQFYDYTKIPNRKNIPANYDLTFSYSGVVSFAPYVRKAVSKGERLAVVFDKKENFPEVFLGLPVVSGDDSDVRHLDKRGAVVALFAKGKAKKDMSGFVVRAA